MLSTILRTLWLALIAAVMPLEASAAGQEGRAALERIIAGKNERIAIGAYGALNPTSAEFADHARCGAYYLMKEIDALGGPAAARYHAVRMSQFQILTDLAERTGYHHLDPLAYSLRAAEDMAPDALNGKIVRPTNCTEA